MTGRHRHWHRAWALDRPGCSATHANGLAVRYTPIQGLPDPMPQVAGLCWLGDARWLVEPTPESLTAWLESPDVVRANLEARLARLMREAGELWRHHHDH